MRVKKPTAAAANPPLLSTTPSFEGDGAPLSDGGRVIDGEGEAVDGGGAGGEKTPVGDGEGDDAFGRGGVKIRIEYLLKYLNEYLLK